MFDRSQVRWILLVFALVIWSLPAQAERFHVSLDGTRISGPSVPGDWSADNCYATLAVALTPAAAADSILFASAVHTVDSLLDLDVAFLGNSTLSSDWSDATLDLGNDGRLNSPGSHLTLRIQGLTLRGGDSQRLHPALVTEGTDLELSGCRFHGFHANADGNDGGSAFRLLWSSTLVAEDCEISDNHCLGRGGAVFVGSLCTISFERCRFLGNSARTSGDPRGGAIHVDGHYGGSVATFLDCELSNNICGGPGGAASMRNCSVTWERCVIAGNRSGQDNGWSEGAGLHHNRYTGESGQPMTATALNCTFENNKGATDLELNGGDGGGFFASGALDGVVQSLVEDCLFRDNYNLQGAGVYISRYAEGIIRRCRFIDNTAYYMGGGAFKGGPFAANDGETLLIEQSLFVRNLAGYDTDGNPTLDYNRGGAICCRMHPRVVAKHCTFVDNRCSQSSYYFGDAFAHYFEYGAWNEDNLCVLQNCVFWGETGSHQQVYSTDGGMEAVDNCALVAGELNIGDFVPSGLVALAASPFESLDTGYPLTGGPLIDAGLDLGYTADIDGQPMPVGGAPDIGCYEWYDVVAVGDDLPAATPVLTVGPNPFNPRTVLSCRLAVPAEVYLVLYDSRGHQVRQLWSGLVTDGEHRWTWNGSDDAGRDCATGVYLARLVIDGRRAVTHKLALVR